MKRSAISAVVGGLALTALACSLSGGGEGTEGAEVGDYVWVDANADGIQQDEEAGLPGVVVELHTADRVTEIASTTTDRDGRYAFLGVDKGEYRIYFDPPEGFEFTQKDRGNDDAKDSDAFQDGPDRGWTDPFTIDLASDDTRDAGLLPTVAFVETPTPTPLGRIGQDFPTVTPQPEQKVAVRITVFLDEAGHLRFVALPEEADLPVLREGDQITLVFEGQDATRTSIELSGTVGPDGEFIAEGAGLVAGFPAIHGMFQGRIAYDDRGLTELTGQLTLGDDGKLPQGKRIVYDVTLAE